MPFGFVGVKLGRLSKSTKKLPCSPHPPVGVAVADEAGNGLLDVPVVAVVVALWTDVWTVLRLLVLELTALELAALVVARECPVSDVDAV